MTLKNSKFLKFFGILLFSIELLAPLFLSSPTEKFPPETTQKNVHDVSHQFNLLTFLLCEEAGIEGEREGRDHKVCFILAEFSVVVTHYPVAKAELPKAKIGPSGLVASQPSLITKLGTYRI